VTFSLLGSSTLFSNMVASSFVCVILPLYFQLVFVISSRTVGMPRSACSSPFGKGFRNQIHVGHADIFIRMFGIMLCIRRGGGLISL
jgi:hypothetical protein